MRSRATCRQGQHRPRTLQECSPSPIRSAFLRCSPHLAGRRPVSRSSTPAFKLQTGVRVAHVPYSALPQAIGDLLNGTNHYQFITPLPVLDLIATGKLRALAVTAPERLAALRDIPTVGEAGFPNLIIQDWIGLLVKAGTHPMRSCCGSTRPLTKCWRSRACALLSQRWRPSLVGARRMNSVTISNRR